MLGRPLDPGPPAGHHGQVGAAARAAAGCVQEGADPLKNELSDCCMLVLYTSTLRLETISVREGADPLKMRPV